MCTSLIEAVEFVVEAVDCCKLLCALESSSFVEAVESVVVKAVDCCRLLYAIESSSFIKAVESIFVEDVDCCRLHYVLYRALVLSKLLNLWLLKLLIVVGYYIL